MIRNKILNNTDIQKDFYKEDIASVGKHESEDEERKWDDDMQDFDQLMD